MNFIYILSAAEGKKAPVINAPTAPSIALALGGFAPSGSLSVIAPLPPPFWRL